LKGILTANQKFSRFRKADFVAKRSIHLSEETHVSLQRKQSLLEAGPRSTLIPSEN
jgi:hypothetical protein